MKDHRRHEPLDEFIEDAPDRQRNIVFPDTVRNGRSVDAFFWHGSPNPSLVQRIAAWMFGTAFIVLGLSFLYLLKTIKTREIDDWIGIITFSLISPGSVLLGIRIFRNGFPRRK